MGGTCGTYDKKNENHAGMYGETWKKKAAWKA
jgi:hypothetical protein